MIYYPYEFNLSFCSFLYLEIEKKQNTFIKHFTYIFLNYNLKKKNCIYYLNVPLLSFSLTKQLTLQANNKSVLHFIILLLI